jgi:excinuclease UvrABC nuclease subunit
MLKKNLYKPDRIYENSLLCKDDILKENRNKVGIYQWSNTINKKRYIGRSISLTRRLLDYYNPNY